MTVWMFIDPYSSDADHTRAMEWNAEHPDQPAREGVDMEYEDVERVFREGFPEEKITFHRGKLPHDLKNANPDYYVFDIGGMDMGGTSRGHFCNEVARQLADHPNTTFVPWSAFTHRYAEGAIQELLVPDPNGVWEDSMLGRVPNILILDSKSCYDGLLEDTILARLRTLYQERRKK